jgi:hypothetical protein
MGAGDLKGKQLWKPRVNNCEINVQFPTEINLAFVRSAKVTLAKWNSTKWPLQ